MKLLLVAMFGIGHIGSLGVVPNGGGAGGGSPTHYLTNNSGVILTSASGTRLTSQ